jgi:phosphoglycerate dehydrogenase-like enzyme
MKIAFHGKGTHVFADGFEALMDVPVEARVLDLALADADERAWFATADVVVGARLNATMPVPKAARLYQGVGAGFDQIALARLPAGCALCNCYGHEAPIAEYVIAALLNRHIPFAEADAALRRGDWSWGHFTAAALRGEWSGSRLGIVGYGHIGREVARKAAAFDVTVHVANRSEVDDPIRVARWWPLAELAALCAEVDALVVTLPASPETDGIVGAACFDALPMHAVLINVGRGAVVDERALYAALRDERIASAVIDTWYVYPSPDAPNPTPGNLPFHGLDNVVMTPHFSGWTTGLVARRRRTMAENVRRLARGEPLVNVVKPAV